MNDDDIRTLVREAIARHLGPSASVPSSAGAAADRSTAPPAVVSASISFHRYAVPRIADDAMCLIEPAVRCNHCGYCECHGH